MMRKDFASEPVRCLPGILSRHTLYATETSGRLIEEASGLTVRKFLAGHVGGVQQLALLIEQNALDLMIFCAIR